MNCDKDLDNQIITPVPFLSVNIKTSTPVLTVNNVAEKINPNYHAEEKNTADKLLESWRRGQQDLQQYWELWKNHYV